MPRVPLVCFNSAICYQHCYALIVAEFGEFQEDVADLQDQVKESEQLMGAIETAVNQAGLNKTGADGEGPAGMSLQLLDTVCTAMAKEIKSVLIFIPKLHAYIQGGSSQRQRNRMFP